MTCQLVTKSGLLSLGLSLKSRIFLLCGAVFPVFAITFWEGGRTGLRSQPDPFINQVLMRQLPELLFLVIRRIQ